LLSLVCQGGLTPATFVLAPDYATAKNDCHTLTGGAFPDARKDFPNYIAPVDSWRCVPPQPF
jgi:hypothetical protein